MASASKTVLFLDHTPFLGGAQLALVELLKKLDRGKIRPFIINSTAARDLGLTAEYEGYQLPYQLLPWPRLKKISLLSPLYFLRNLKKIIKIIKREKVDLIFTNTVRAAIFAAAASLLTHRPLIWYQLDYTFPRLLFEILKRVPARIFYVSRSLAEYYEGHGVEREKVFYLWSNFSEKLADISFKTRDDKRRELGIKEDEVLLGYLGRLVNWKGPQILIAALKLLRVSGYNNVKALIAGTGKNQRGDNEAELKCLVREEDLAPAVIFTGWEKDNFRLMRALDILCLTSLGPEPFSSVVLEAMMANVSVIATTTGGTPEINEPEALCLLVKPGRAEDLAEKIKTLINDKSLAAELKEKARLKVQAYTTAAAAAHWQEIFFTLLKS